MIFHLDYICAFYIFFFLSYVVIRSVNGTAKNENVIILYNLYSDVDLICTR